ncbi:hypothetical protein ADUPG1_006747, partial [Aduncisulcus paluster]
CNVSPDTDFTSFTNLTTLSLNDNPLYDITESGLFPSPSSLTSFSANNTSISLLFHLVASMPNLTELSLNNNNISDPSPLYALSSSGSWNSLDLSYNHICGGDNGDSAIEIILAEKLSLSVADVNANDQDCICSSDDLGSTPFANNKVCAETLPGVSNTWYVVCASDSFTSYTSAEDFTCIQPDSSTTNCSGGCEYGYECRYLDDEVIGDDTFTTGECQQVIVDDNLHAYVADMFVDSDGQPDYTHRIGKTEDIPSLFSVASLRTIVSVEDSEGNISPSLVCQDTSISDLSGIEHLGGILRIEFLNCIPSDDVNIELISTLTNLKMLYFYNNVNMTYLPDLTLLTNLDFLSIASTSIDLPSDRYVLPKFIKSLVLFSSNVSQDGFDKNVGFANINFLEILIIGGENNAITSINSLSTMSQLASIKTLIVQNSPNFGDSFNSVIENMSNLETLTLQSCDLVTIPDLSNSAGSLTNINLNSNPLLTALSPIISAGLSNLSSLNVSGCNISDPTPLYALSGNSSCTSLDLSNNHICESDNGDAQTILESRFSSCLDIVINVDDQVCECSDSDPIPNLSDNKVCSETKPGSGSWFVVCASDSYTSYTDASTFSCISPNNGDGTFGCSGGCEYGYECRYDSESTSTSCQRVIVDPELHWYVYELLPESHRTLQNLYSIASLKTLVSEPSVPTLAETPSPRLVSNDANRIVSDLSGLEHLTNVTYMSFGYLDISEANDLEPFTTLTNLTYLYIVKLKDTTLPSFDLPDLTPLTDLETLNITNSPFSLPSDKYVLPLRLKYLYMYGTPIDQDGFDKNIGNDRLLYLESLYFGSETCLISSIDSLSANQRTTMKDFTFTDTPIPQSFFGVISSMTNLHRIDLGGTELTEFPDLSKSKNSLEIVLFGQNPAITSLVPLVQMNLSKISSINFPNCSISDISPLYDLPTISLVRLVNNKLCLGSDAVSILGEKFTQDAFNRIIGGFTQNCECSSDSTEIGYSDTPITDNKVCSETLPGSGSWHYVCSSHSIASYTSADTFECLTTDNGDGTYGCSGGCEYGYECRYDSDSELSSCQQVIVDDNLHAYVADMFVDSDGQPDYTHRIGKTEDDPSLFSVASLRTISTSTLSNDGFALSNSDRFTLLDGIEHIRSLTSISLPYHNFVSTDPLGSLHGLESLSLAHNMYGAPEDADGNAIEGFSDLSFICSLHSLSTLTLSSVTSVSALPDTSECADTYTSLSSLNLAETSIIDVSALLVAADSTNVSLTELIMNGVSLYDDVAETTSLFDPSILESFSSISSLGLASLGLVDSDLLSI